MSILARLSNPVVAILEHLGRRPTLAFFTIFCISATIRTGLLMRVPSAEIAGRTEAELIGFSIAEHGTFSDPYMIPTGPSAHTPPFYPFLVAGVYRIFGGGYVAGLVRCGLLIGIYSALYALYPVLGRALGLPVSAGVLAGLLCAVLPLKRSAEFSHGWDEPYAALAAGGLMVLTLRIWESRRLDLGMAAAYGLGWGLAFHMAPSLAPVLAAFCLVHVIRFSNGQRWRAIRWWGLTLACVTIAILPWTLRNFNQLGGWMFMRDNLGLELYIANQDQSQPTHQLNTAMANAAHPSNREEAARTVRAIGEVAYNRQLMHSALVWIADNPARFLRLTAIRAIYFWSAPTEHPETLAASALLTIFALAGFAAMAREGSVERTALFATVWLVYPLLYYVVQFSPRYRVPIDWSITLPAGLFLYQRLKAWSSIPGFPVSEPV